MAIHKGKRWRATPPQIEPTTIPAPAGGVNARSPIGQLTPDDAIYTFNMMPSETGMVVRRGYREWVIDIETAPDASFGVTSILTFTTAGTNDDRLFAVTNEGIWDVTTFDSVPVQKLVFSNQSVDAGHGNFVNYVDQAGAELMFYADSINGLFTYDAATDAWAQTTGITGITITDVNSVVVHKLRMWLGTRNSPTGFYLPPDAIAGAATAFFFGTKFPHGGHLVGLYNWTVDGGTGVDDYLVGLSSAGDVLPYRGDDPSSADTWELQGSYFIGALPNTLRIADEYGGDLHFLSSYGLFAMSDLLRGVGQLGADDPNSLSWKIASIVRAALVETGAQRGWEPKFLPSQGQLLITAPPQPGAAELQYGLNLANRGWGFWRDVPVRSIEEWQGKVYFGDDGAKIHVMDVGRDAVEIDPADPSNNGKTIGFSTLTSYQHYGTPSVFKQAQYIRPDFLSQTPPIYNIKILYDYDLSELLSPTGTLPPDSSAWDVGSWDEAVWGGAGITSQHKLSGTGGLGRVMAVALRGESSDRTQWVSTDVMWKTGGIV